MSAGMGTPPVFCVGRTQGSSRADTGDFFSDTGEFQGEFPLMEGFPGGEQGVFLYMKDRNLLNRINIVFWNSLLRRLRYILN